MKPSSDPQKQSSRVAGMFDRISGKYDFLNRFFSVGVDRYWRRKAVRTLALQPGSSLLDVAAGTADLSLEACRQCKSLSVVGVDISEGMLSIGREKIQKAGLTGVITLQKASAESLPFSDQTFDAVMAAFGVRNFEHPEAGLSEMLRVVKPGGRIVILEFSRPSGGLFGVCFDIYFRSVMPVLGRWISSDDHAYTYLPETVIQFPSGSAFVSVLKECGYTDLQAKPLTKGLVTVYSGIRPDIALSI